jgi:uncharacterized Zn finger protein (UPF0148 family)
MDWMAAHSGGSMARFQCRQCGFDGHGEWAGKLVCPACGSTTGVRAAMAAIEMTEEEIQMIARSEYGPAEKE